MGDLRERLAAYLQSRPYACCPECDGTGEGDESWQTCGHCEGSRVDPKALAELEALVSPLLELMRNAGAFAKYHEEHARYGGASWEFHARAHSALQAMADAYRELTSGGDLPPGRKT